MIDYNFNLSILEQISENPKYKIYKCFVKETWQFYALKTQSCDRLQIIEKSIKLKVKSKLSGHN